MVCVRQSSASAPDPTILSKYLTNCLPMGAHRGLLVLDNVHHLFDAGWFPEFFRQMIISLGPETRLLMLCRSRPSAPLWRLRSKQMLNVIDETIINLTLL